jgi:excreted virulence factor EspC (type VII ESX diderm)
MPDHGVDLGVDLYKLLVVAKNDLPSVATIYTDAGKQLSAAASSVDGVMRRPDHFGDAFGPVHSAWVTLHDVASSVLTTTASSLTDTASVLADSAQRYADTDHAAAQTFHNLLRVNGEPRAGE